MTTVFGSPRTAGRVLLTAIVVLTLAGTAALAQTSSSTTVTRDRL
jgi:hypothetical protein